MEALFSSRDGGDGLRSRVTRLLDDVAAVAQRAEVVLHIMTFSFTDAAIAERVRTLAVTHPDVTIRIIADWNQGSLLRNGPIRRFVEQGLDNLVVRYKLDQPYVWDPTGDRLRWSYRASRGLLHHKTLGVFVDGEPAVLLCGSANWTSRAARGYENLLLVGAGDRGGREVMEAVEREFESLWTDGRLTVSPSEASRHYDRILEEYRRRPTTPPMEVVGLGRGADAPLPPMVPSTGSADVAPPDPGSAALIAFSSRSPHDPVPASGYSAVNRARRFELHKPSGKRKRVPLTMTNLALDTFARAQAGDTVKVAMYGLSPRVAEYGALLEAARRGVRLQVLLDGTVGRAVLAQLAVTLVREDLPIRLRASSRTMHQKYVVHRESATVLTGTANMSTDATARHSEHRIVVRGDAALTRVFLADFATIWSRLASPFRPPTGTGPS